MIRRDRGGRILRDKTLANRMRARYRRDRPACWLCGQAIDYDAPMHHPRALVVDHVIPISRGGLDVEANCRPCCWACNDRKRASVVAPPLNRSATLVR